MKYGVVRFPGSCDETDALLAAERLGEAVLLWHTEHDLQGVAVERALPALGFDGVANVHVGRLIELDVEDASQVPRMCERLLANPLIEDYEIQTAGEPAASAPA